MDADVDSAWISTQVVVSTDIQPDNEQEKINDYGCIVLNGMIDNGRYVLKEGDNTIGRHPLNDIYIEHPSVSMNHAVIQCDSDGVVLLDKGSLNKTKLNKKNLRKDVAYFLEENALLMFGEVQADYFINEESNEFINNTKRDTKSIASNNISIHKEIQNDGLSLSTLSNTVNVSESLRSDIPNAITNCNVSSIIENSSTCMIEKAVPQTITGSECPVNTFDDIHAELISPSPSDEYLLEALSQIETMQNNIDSNKIFQNLSNKDTLIINTTESVPKVTREDTPSPVMDLKNSILTTNNKTKSLCQSPNKINIEATREDTPSPVMDLESSFITTNNISGSIFQSSNKINTELIREDTPSPTMDLENSFETINNIPGRIFQTPNKINTELIREDTPSPIMDFGCYNDSENKLETNNHGIISAIQSPNKDDELNNTQVVEISNFKSENTSISINRSLIQKQNLSMNNLFCKSQKVESDDQSKLTTTNVFDNHSNDNLSCSNNINSNKKSSVKPAEHLNGIHNDGLNNVSEQNRSTLTIPNLKSDTEGNNTKNYNKNFNTFEADDDDIFSNFIENESKSQKQNLNILENQDIFNSPTQKVSTDKNINLKSNVSNEIHKEKTQEMLEFTKSGKDNSSLSTNNSTSIHEELTQIPEMDDDFFNCPTQKYAFPKKKNENPKTSSLIHEEETQKPSELVHFNKTKTSISKPDVLEIDNEDFFNCQTQKLSITKNTNPKQKVSSTIHEEETQVPEIHDDFFNCPTQKYAYPKNINEKPKISSSIHEKETQRPSELVQFNKTKTSPSYTLTKVFKINNEDFFDFPTQKLSITKNINSKPKVSSTIYEEETQVPEMNDDFYNCPTQKLSIPKKINEKPKTSSSIHEEETQRSSELVRFNKTKTSSSNTEINVLKIDNDDFFDCPTQKLSITKNTNQKPKVSSTIHEEETQVPEMHDDFFNCPTQKYAYPKKINEKPKISSSIHEEETQRPSELVQFNKTKTSTANTKTDVFIIDNDDFFDCPTQKLSINKNTNQKSKVSSTIHEKETQNIFEFSKPNKNNLTVSKDNSNSIHEEETQVPEMDDDFYNCPTQKLSVSKKINEKPKISSSIHEEETQRPSELVQFNKTKTSTANTKTDVFIIDNDDFFECPTQKLSINKNTNQKSKVSSTIHEKETQNIFEFSKPNKNNLTVSKDNSTSIHEEETHVPEMDDDFYNFPTQKLSVSKKINERPKISSSIHEEETQRPSELVQFNKTKTSTANTKTDVFIIDNDNFFDCPTQKLSINKNTNQKPKVSSTIHEKETQNIFEFSKPNKNNLNVSKDNSTSIHEEETQVPEMDDDFYNCPTQKLSVSKKIYEKPKTSSSIHEEETQKPSELVQFNKRKTCSTNTETKVLKIDNDDFFNCPTQKLSITKNTNQKPKVSSTIHEKETQNIFEFSKPNKNNLTVSKDNSTSIHEEETQVPEMDDDFYNCPTQKLSVSKKINEKPKISSSIHEEETQRPSELVQFNKTKTSTANTKTDVFIIDNDDFFDCPTQKLSITKNTNQNPKVSSTIHEKETQNIFELLKPNKNNLTVSKDNSTSIHEEETQVPEMDDDFYNCPTQKLSVSKKIYEKPKTSSSIHEEETQKPSELVQFNKRKTSSSNTETKVLIIDNEDFFNCPTQKLSITKNTNPKPKLSSTIHEEETQVTEMDDNFFNCPTQKISIPKKINQSLNVATIANKENSQKPPEFSKLNKINTNISKTDSTNKHKRFDECTLNNHKKTVEHDNENTDKVKKSKCVNSNIIRLSNVQLPVMCKENSSNSLKMNKPKIRVREDLCISYSNNSSNSSNSTIILNKPIEKNTVMNNINTSVPLNKNLNSPSCSKSPTDRENVLNMLSSIKQENFSDDSAQSRVTISNKFNDRLKRMDESIFSPLNIPDISADSLSKQHSSSKTVEDNLNSLNCEPSTSNNDASIWKSFWNKKKVQCQVKGKSDKQNNITYEVKENKERYQTRAITRKENASKLNRKRKQDGDEESNKKICTRNKILEPLVENSSEIVVSFSYLKSRHLQEMKQFVDKTGGSVTDEITQCTVLVTDKIRCTMKILSAIARGCPIVNANWLKHSYTVKMFQDANDFLIVDKDAERKYQFQLKESLAKAKTKKLLDGYNVLVTPSVKPGPQEMKVIISCAGGNYVLNWTDTQCTKELIVTCDKDRNRWKPAWDNDFAKIIDSDTLVTSIIRQKLTI